MFERIKDFLSNTTGLTSPLRMRPVPKDAFISAFAMAPGAQVAPKVRSGFGHEPPGESVGRILFETGLDALQKVGDRASELPSLLYDTAKRVGIAITRFIHPEGGAISVVSDRDGRSIEGSAAGLTTQATRAAASPEPLPSAMDEARRANETVMRYRLQSVAQSHERAAFQDFIQPMDEYGGVHIVPQMGWAGLIQSVRGLPVPSSPAGNESVMDVIGGRTLRMGVSVLTCADTRANTLKKMLDKALELKLEIPGRADGMPWNSQSPVDREMATALCGRPDSPFVTGKMLEGSPILLNDSSLVDLGKISSRLTTAALERTFSKVRTTMEQGFLNRIEMAPSNAVRSQAKDDLETLRASPEFGTFDDSRQAKAGTLAVERIKVEKEAAERRAADPNGLEAFLAQMDAIDSKGGSYQMARNDVLPPAPAHPAQQEELSWSDVAISFPHWSPGEEHISLKMENGAISPTLHLTDSMMERLGTSNREISNMDGFILTDLKPGSYKVEGASEPLNIYENGGVKSMEAPEQKLEPQKAPAPAPSILPVFPM